MSEIRVTELDFDSIKTNLKNFLKSQSELTDYDFDGSALSILLDVLAYNTHYNAVGIHLLANEMFLDTAIKRSSVISLAKMLGYTPRSARSAVAKVSVTLTPSGTPSPTISLPITTAFTAIIDNRVFTFYPVRTYTASYDSLAGTYTFPEVYLVEGVYLQSRFTVTSDTVSGPFVLPNPNIDTTTLRVWVSPSSDSLQTTAYTQVDTIVNVSTDSLVYWIEETPAGQYQILFGNGVLGAPLSTGNIVIAEFFQTSGNDTANGAQAFNLATSLVGIQSASVTTLLAASGGAAPESIDSIRFTAPRMNTTRNRAVTAEDYKSLIKSQFPYVKGITVWGGETNTPPIFGKVFISIDPVDDYVLTESDKANIISEILAPRTMMTLQHEFVDPDYLYIGLGVNVKYNGLTTTLSSDQIGVLVKNAIVDYFTNQVSTLDNTMYYSKLLSIVDDADPSIVGSQVTLRLHRVLTPVLYADTVINTTFTTALEPGSIRSTRFYASVNGTPITNPVFVQDVPEIVFGSDPTSGSLKLVDATTGLVVVDSFGSVNYTTGEVSVGEIFISGYPTGVDSLLFYATPQDGFYDIAPAKISQNTSVDAAVFPLPAKNIVLRLDQNGLNTVAGIETGVVVLATSIIEGR